jgi:hypothetical protein
MIRGFPSRRWARGLWKGRESSDRLLQNGWSWLANSWNRMEDDLGRQAPGTTLLGSGAPAGGTGQVDGAGGW